MADLTDLALTCKEMSQQVIELSLPALADKVHSMIWQEYDIAPGKDGELPPIWDTILSTPKSCSHSDLKVKVSPLP